MEPPLPPLRQRGTCFHPAGSGQIDFSDGSYPACVNASGPHFHLNAAKWSRVNPPEKDQAVRRARPFWRRRLMMLRPAAVAMRAKNPSRRLRRRLEGWKVLFIFLFVLFFLFYSIFSRLAGILTADILRHCNCRFLKITPLCRFFKPFCDNIFTKWHFSAICGTIIVFPGSV